MQYRETKSNTCNAIQCNTMQCKFLQQCWELECLLAQCNSQLNPMWVNATQHNAMQCNAAHVEECDVMRCVQCNAMQYSSCMKYRMQHNAMQMSSAILGICCFLVIAFAFTFALTKLQLYSICPLNLAHRSWDTGMFQDISCMVSKHGTCDTFDFTLHHQMTFLWSCYSLHQYKITTL